MKSTIISTSISTILAAITCIILSGSSCQRQQNPTTSQERPKLETPDFNADSAYSYTEIQVGFGPRVPNTLAHDECARFLANKLESFGAVVVNQQAKVRSFDNKILNITNVIGQFQPEKNDRILLFAHWDSRPFADHDKNPSLQNMPISGANDGASAVGVLLEIARHLRENPTYPGVDILFFDAEDYGQPDHIKTTYKPDTWCLGSQYWSKNPHKPRYYARFGILLDMIGAKDALFYKEQLSVQTAKSVVDKVWQTAASLGYGQTFIDRDGGYITDDHLYVNKNLKIPCVDIIQYNNESDTGFGDYWHTQNDVIDNVNKEKLSIVGQTVMEVIYSEK